MISRLLGILVQERFSIALIFLFSKIFDQLIGRARAMLLGWPNSYLGSYSKIVGTKSIAVGKHAYVNRFAWIEAVHQFGSQSFQPSILIGRGFAVADNLHISCINKIEIGDNCLFGSGVYISDHNHGAYKGVDQSEPFEPPVKRRLVSFGSIVIGSNVWLGDNVVIVGSVKIGNGVVIGANSVVTKDVPDNIIAVGSPLEILKKFNESNGMWERVK